MKSPSIVVLAGPNGAGKSTLAPVLLPTTLGITEFVNADVIAQGLSAFAPERTAVAAGRIMLDRMNELAQARSSFGFETTLASRSFAPWLGGLRASGYRVHLVFLWLPTADLAVQRVASRVLAGGHDVPEEAIRRRFDAGWRNFFDLYQAATDTWRVYDSSDVTSVERISVGAGTSEITIYRQEIWTRIVETYRASP